ncbi:hypothetical protein NTGM5_620026 [Candidatus Nitrotoga sp. M5]|nr:hypothetical protein NTGM5_620026 [Candidatus Nitrotoga sp. M5]
MLLSATISYRIITVCVIKFYIIVLSNRGFVVNSLPNGIVMALSEENRALTIF